MMAMTFSLADLEDPSLVLTHNTSMLEHRKIKHAAAGQMCQIKLNTSFSRVSKKWAPPVRIVITRWHKMKYGWLRVRGRLCVPGA
jgi:hypothetical protein